MRPLKPTAPKLDEIISQGIYGCEQGCGMFIASPLLRVQNI